MTRDRDASGRPRNARPRDATGRPLPRDGSGEPPVDTPALPPTQALATAQSLLDDGRAFTAHEVLEAVWKSTSGDERALWRGLAQLAVALTHRQRGNMIGASALFARAAATLHPWAGRRPHGINVDALRSWCRQAADGTTDAGPPPLVGDQAADERA